MFIFASSGQGKRSNVESVQWSVVKWEREQVDPWRGKGGGGGGMEQIRRFEGVPAASGQLEVPASVAKHVMYACALCACSSVPFAELLKRYFIVAI